MTFRRLDNGARIGLQGRPSTQDSWFPGYAWTIAYCARCYSHLGWKFTLVADTATRNASATQRAGGITTSRDHEQSEDEEEDEEFFLVGGDNEEEDDSESEASESQQQRSTTTNASQNPSSSGSSNVVVTSDGVRVITEFW
jgi:hypothetical protein